MHLSSECAQLSDYAKDISQNCHMPDEESVPAFAKQVCGQKFDTGNWNIVVAKQTCGSRTDIPAGLPYPGDTSFHLP